jgi:peptide chain release factor 1
MAVAADYLLKEKLETMERRYEEIETLLSQPETAQDSSRLLTLVKERASLEETVARYREYKATLNALDKTRALQEEGLEPEMAALVKDELTQLRERQEKLLEGLKKALFPPDPRDEKDVIMEVRAGTGGEEAALFAADLYRMYARYAQAKGWQAEVIDTSPSEKGGVREIVFEIKGKGAFSRLKYESGVHRVQRVPVTEASGRIHTSTATVAVLPEAEDVEVNIRPEDLKVDIFHSSGAGGQNVQKVATAVRITHIPTGIVTVCQDERSQLRNRQKAMAVLRARLFDRERCQQQEETARERRSQVGTGERAEKVRTYNFPQNRVTDHRINLALHNLPRILEGELDSLVDALVNAPEGKV